MGTTKGGSDQEPTPGVPGSSPDPSAGSADTARLLERLVEAEARAEDLKARVDGTEWLAAKIAEQRAELVQLRAELAAASAELDRYRALRFTRLADRAVRKLVRAGRSSLAGRARAEGPGAQGADGEAEPLVEPSSHFVGDDRYPTWAALYDTIDDTVRATLRSRLDAVGYRPLVSVVLPVFDTPEEYLRAAIDSVRAQLYDHWELCIADDCSTAPWVPKILGEYAAADPRIKVERRSVNGHISHSSNTALAMATGEWVALFDHDDVLREHALAVAVLALGDHPDAAVLYSDEDHLGDDGTRSAPYFKPDFDPLLLLGQNYLSHLCMLRREVVERVGRFRPGYEGSQDWDLVLRATEVVEPSQVVHVPHVLYHWRVHPGSTASSLSAKPYAAVAAQRAVRDHLERRSQRGQVSSIGSSGFNRVRWELPDPPPAVSVVVLPRKGVRLLRCLDSVRVRSTYPDVELVVVDDGAELAPLRQFLRDHRDGLTVVREERDVSDSALRNAGARAARGEVLCFLDDDVEVLTDRWLEELVGFVSQPGVGAVGAKLLYPDGTVQHAGVVGGIGTTVGNIHRTIDRLEPGYFGRAMLAQSFSAVSWACMAVRREAFEAVGGFDEEHLSDLFGDVDFCLRLGEAGWRIGWTPHAELLHAEDKEDARPTDGENQARFAREIRYLRSRWGAVLDRDPAYNPNLSLAHETVPLAWPPRTSYR